MTAASTKWLAAATLGAWLGLGGGAALAQPASGAAAAVCPALLQHTMKRLQDDAPQPLCQYAGKVLLVVNTASRCGFTPQYTGLEALHTRYAARGLVVMGFPSNDFGEQEPGDAAQIGQTCFNLYGVRFPMFAKIAVKGAAAHPFYTRLAQDAGQAPAWNFHKYLLDRQGRLVAGFVSDVDPADRRLVAAIEKLLAAP